jgi:hypothetical protein
MFLSVFDQNPNYGYYPILDGMPYKNHLTLLSLYHSANRDSRMLGKNQQDDQLGLQGS